MILITGHKGFIGSEIIKNFESNKYDFDLFIGDITSISDVENHKDDYETIIHTASIITHKNISSEAELYNVNLNGTVNLLKKFSNSHFVYISTTDVERNILTNYAKSKLEAEQLVLSNKNNLVIRLPSIFGAKSKQKKLIPLLIEKYLFNSNFLISNNERREYMYVKECAKLIVDCMYKRGIVRFNGVTILNQELEDIIKDIIKDQKRIYHNMAHAKLYDNLHEMINEIKGM